MGDRGEVVLIESGISDNALPIRFYTHWGATDLPNTVASALKRGRGRWGDDSYLNRIIFSEMIQSEVLEDIGYGITLAECDAWRTVTVNHVTKTVEISDLEQEWSFEGFIEAFG
jgi:hypothetical protein